MTKPRIYVDSNVIIGYVKAEPDKIAACAALFEEAKAGKIEIITASITAVEVLKHQGDVINPAAGSIAAFLKHRWLKQVQVDHRVSVQAQEVRQRCLEAWEADNDQKTIRGMDALHFATALVWGAERFVTYNLKDYRTAAEFYSQFTVERPNPSPVQATLSLPGQQSASGQDPTTEQAQED